MKTLIKIQLKSIFLVLFLISVILSSHANPNGKKEKKSANLYKKTYINHPLYVLAMHNGEKYAFINSFKKEVNTTIENSDSEKLISKNEESELKEKESCSETMLNDVSSYDIIEESELIFEDWMISSFDSITPIETELIFEDWMINEEHWKLKE